MESCGFPVHRGLALHCFSTVSSEKCRHFHRFIHRKTQVERARARPHAPAHKTLLWLRLGACARPFAWGAKFTAIIMHNKIPIKVRWVVVVRPVVNSEPMVNENQSGPTETKSLVHAVRLVRVRKQGQSIVVVLPPLIRHQMGLVYGDVLGFRVILVQKRILLIGEKVGTQRIARIDELPAELLVPVKGNG